MRGGILNFTRLQFAKTYLELKLRLPKFGNKFCMMALSLPSYIFLVISYLVIYKSIPPGQYLSRQSLLEITLRVILLKTKQLPVSMGALASRAEICKLQRLDASPTNH